MTPLRGQIPTGDDPFREPSPLTESGEQRRQASARQSEAAIKANWTRDEKGGMTGSLRISGRVAIIAGALLALGGTAFGYLGHGDTERPVPVPVPALVGKVDGLEARLSALENAVSKMDGKLDVLINRGGK